MIQSTLTRLEYWMTQAEFGPGSGRRVCREGNGQRTDETKKKNRVDLPEDISSSTQEEGRRREYEMGARENRHTEQIGNESHCPGGDSKATQDTSRTKASRKSFCEPDEAARDVRQQPAGRGDWRWKERKQ